MSERIRHFSGDLTVTSDPAGTIVRVIVPFKSSGSMAHSDTDGQPIQAVA